MECETCGGQLGTYAPTFRDADNWRWNECLECGQVYYNCKKTSITPDELPDPQRQVPHTS